MTAIERQNMSADFFEQAIRSSSAAMRRKAFDLYVTEGMKPETAIRLLSSQSSDLRESVLDTITRDTLSQQPWTDAIDSAVSASDTQNCVERCLGLLIILQKTAARSRECTAFCLKCLEHADPEVRYQAFCAAEIGSESSTEYIDYVRKKLKSSDEDMRIVAIQAVSRLNPAWGPDELQICAQKATGVEAFHILLSQIRICPESQKAAFAQKLAAYIDDGRFSFAAIQALRSHGNAAVIPELVRYARGIFNEPTTRVAAAAAAAKLGSQDAVKILRKFASSRHGNPNYAKEQLETLGLTLT